MKKLLVLAIAMMSLNLFANEKSAAYPQLNVWPNSVEVRIWNTSQNDIQCSGSIFIYTQQNRFKSEYFNRIIPARQHAYQRFHNWYPQDAYRNAHHSIFCREIRK